MVQIKMRPIFSRGNSVASMSVAAPKPDDTDEHQDDTTTSHDEREAASLTGSPSSRRSPATLRRRRRLAVDAHVAFSDVVTEHPPGEALTDKEVKAYFYSVDDLKRFDRDRALTAMMYRSGKHPNGGDGPWDDNVHSVRGLEDFLCGVPSRGRDIGGGFSGSPTSSSPSSSSVSSYRGSSCLTTTDRERERREHARTILMEQARLRAEGRDPMSEALVLREVSAKSSCESRREALERGRDDAHAASRRLDASTDTTANVLRTVRGRLYALMEKQPSLRAMGSSDRQPSQRNLLSMDRQTSLRSLLGGGEKQPSVRNLLGAADKSP